MAKIVHYRRANTTQISNEMLQSRMLTWKAKGLLACLLSFPDGWTYRRDDIVNNRSAEGEGVWRSTIKELVTRGYISRHKTRLGGRWEYNYLISDTPLPMEAAERFAKTGKL